VVIAVWLRFVAKSGSIWVRKLFGTRNSGQGATPFPVQQVRAGLDEK